MKDNALYRAAKAAYNKERARSAPDGAPAYEDIGEPAQEMWVAYVWTEELDRESYPDVADV